MTPMRSLAFAPDAKAHLDRYLTRVNTVLQAYPSVDANEVEREIRAHIETELAEAPAPISAPRLEEVIERLGHPSQWVPDEELPGWCRALPRLGLGAEDWRGSYMTFALFVVALVTGVSAVRTYWTAWGAEMLVIVGLRTSLLAAVVLLASALLARATLTLLIAGGVPISARRWLVYPPLILAYGILTLAAFVLPPVPVLLAGDPTFRSEMVAWIPEPFGLSFPLLVALTVGAWWSTLGAVAARHRVVVRSVFWPFADWFDRRHGIRIGWVGLTIATVAGVGLTIVIGN